MSTGQEHSRWLGRLALMVLVLGIGAGSLPAARLDPANWGVYALPQVPPPSALRVVTNQVVINPPTVAGQPFSFPNLAATVTDNNPASFATLSNAMSLFIDLGQTCTVHRVYLLGTNHTLLRWPNSQAQTNAPLGLFVVSVGNTIPGLKPVADLTIPCDAGNPIDTELDLRFSPVAGRYVRVALQTNVTWGFQHWPGWQLAAQPPPPPPLSWNVGELEVYGFPGQPANENAVVLPAGASITLTLAAGDLSYYLGELTGKPHPIILPSATNLYPGTIYRLVDLKPLAPDYKTMTNNIAAGLLPDGVNVETNGREVVFRAWPYRCVLWSAWEFLERQGVRWLYPEGHGDFVPTGAGVDRSFLPLRFMPSAKSVYANWDTQGFQPWPPWQLQTVRQGYLYAWRNRWDYNHTDGYGPLGGTEIPAMPSPGITLNSDYTEQFIGYPHNFDGVVPTRILLQHTNWWGYSTNLAMRVAPTNANAPAFCMDNPELINWVGNKLVAVAQAYPIPTVSPLNLVHFRRAYNLLPVDATTFCECPDWCLPANGPWVPNPLPWVAVYRSSFSGMYYSFVAGVANVVRQSGSDALVGALAYADVCLPPTFNLPTNVQVEVCLYGAPTLPMSAAPNAAMKQAFDTWSQRCSHLATYDYSLLHIDYWQTNAAMPVPLVAGSVARAQYLASIGALDGGCQGTVESLPYNPWNFYAYSRIRWNTNQTASQLESEFFNGYFGEAAQPMLAYYQALENHVVADGADLHYRGYCYNIMPGSFPLQVLAAMQTNLVAAEQAATNWLTVGRVAKMREGFDWVISNSGLTGVDLTDVSPYPVLSPTNGPVSLDLTQMTAPPPNPWSNGAQLTGTNWTFWSPGLIRESFYFPTGGTYQVVVTASGVTPDAELPSMTVYLGAPKSTVAVSTSGFADYASSFAIPSGVWDVTITFNNGASAGARDLIISSIRIIPPLVP